MNPPHNDDYLHTQLHEYEAEEPAPAHHLPFDRISPAEPGAGVAGEFGEYMPQADLAGTAADTGGETPASDPAADGDDEDARVAHPDDVEVHRAVADETQGYGAARDEHASGLEEQEGEPGERHAREGQAADVEVARPVVNETHAHGVDLYEEPAGDAEVHDAAVSEWRVDETSVAEADVAGDVYGYEKPATDMDEPELAASDMHAHSKPVADADVDEDTHEAHAADEQHYEGEEHRDEEHKGEEHKGEEHKGEEHRGEEPLHEEHMHTDHTANHTYEGHAHDEPALPDHQDVAGVDAEQYVESEDEEQAAVWMQAGPPDAMMEESDVMVAAHTAHDTPHDDATGAGEALGANGAATAEQAMSMASAHTAVRPPVTEHVSSAGDARGMLEGVAQSLRTLAGRDTNGEGIAIFPRGVDVLEVRMHISRDRDIDLNFRVAGPTASATSI
jgi:hypothetical protein